MRAIRILSLLGIGLALASAAAAEPTIGTPGRRVERARPGEHFRQPTANLAATSSALAAAMDLNPGLLASSSITGSGSANAVLANLGVIQPVQGPSLALLSSGVAGASAPNHPEPGTNFGLPGVGGLDRTELTLTVNVPPGSGSLSFNFLFLSTEYPDFIQAGFNDTFVATLTDAAGTRVISAIEVDNAAFFPASIGRAGGTGFDLFTADPEGVDSVFGTTGLPDAGLTDYLLATSTFQSSGQIQLKFAIQDVGDGILDSAVILDNLKVSNIEIVDVNRDLATGQNPGMVINGAVTTNATILARPAPARIGAAADGITRVLVRTRAGSSGVVTFSIDGGVAPADGGFAPPGSNQRSQSIAVSVDPTSGYAFAVYRVPDEFNRGGDTGPSRTIHLKSVFAPSSGGAAVQSTIPFQLVRPPVVLTHGLWSAPGTWTFPLADDERFGPPKKTDYAATSASRFSTNSSKLPYMIREAIASFQLRSIAATQVDAIGHSMGGLLSRIFTTSAGYKRNDNFNQGDVRKLFTVDTPHTGSPLADFLISLRELPFGVGTLITNKAREYDHPIDEGAIDDLAKHSAAIDSIQACPVPAHALVGTGGSDSLGLIPGQLGAFFRFVTFFTATTGSQLFEGLQHDGVVGRPSQEGGLPPAATTAIGFGDGLHIGSGDPGGSFPGNTASPVYSSRLIALLDTPKTTSSFAFFPAPAGLPRLEEELRPPLGGYTVADGVGLQITAPASGTVVVPGTTIQVTVAVLAGFQANRVLLVGPDIAAVDAAAPFAFSLQLPVELAGPFTLSAVGANASQYFVSQPLNLFAQPAASLVGIETLPQDPILFGSGETTQLTAIGVYSDGIRRDVTAHPDTDFIAVDETIATVGTDGRVTARAQGITTILARNGAAQDSITVTVLPAGALFTDGFESGNTGGWH